MLGLIWFLIANGAVLLGSHALLRRFRTDNASVDIVLFLIFRMVLISLAVFLAGLTHTLSRVGLGLLGSAALAVLLAYGAHRKVTRPGLPEVGWTIGILAILVLLRLVLQVWFFSPHLGDALAYHLPKIGEWMASGGFTREMGLHPHVTFPAGFELIETWWVVFFHHDVMIEMAGVEFLLLAFAASYALANYVGLSPRWSFFTALLYTMTPGLHLSTTSCLNDGPAAALVVATAALIVWRLPLPLVLMTIGLGIGIKPTYGFTLPGLALLWWFVRREARPPGKQSPRLAVALAGLGILMGSFWYARNVMWYGNPFYPLGTPGYFNPTAVQLGPDLASLPANASDLVNSRIYDNQGAYGANVDNISGWGGAAFACGLLALPMCMLTDPRFRKLAAAFLLSLASTLLFVQNDPWCLKYVFFFPAILCIAISRLSETHRGVLGVTIAALVFSFVATFLPYDISLNELKLLAKQKWHERTAADLHGARVEVDAVGCFGGYRADPYLLYGSDFSRRVAYLRPTNAGDLIENMEAAGLRVLYAVPVSPQQHSILDECVRARRLTAISEHLFLLDEHGE